MIDFNEHFSLPYTYEYKNTQVPYSFKNTDTRYVFVWSSSRICIMSVYFAV
jgi:hypothetical protein